MKQLEIEFKSLLGEKDYHRLCDHYQLAEKNFHTQTNVYFDTVDQQLQAQRCGLRIRKYATHGEITLKTPQAVGLLETTDQLTLAETNHWIAAQSLPTTGAVATELAQRNIAIEDLTIIAELTTKRAEFKIPEGLLALDESWYGTQHDYELELEVTDGTAGKVAFDKYLADHHLSYLPAENKIVRAVKQKSL